MAASAVKAEVRICYHNGVRGMLLMMLLMLGSCAIARDWICHTMLWRHDTRRCYLLMAYDLVELEQVEAA